MSAQLEKLREIPDGYKHWCPACKMFHGIWVRGPVKWAFNGEFAKPTFAPSVKVTMRWRDVDRICHYFLTDGQLHYCGDSTHAFAGKVVDLPNLPE